MHKSIIITVSTLLICGSAQALVLEAKSDAQKLRRNVAKQSAKYSKCLAKALRKCEKGTDPFLTNCSLATEIVFENGDSKSRFSSDIARCESKVNFMKRAKDLTPVEAYQSIGCPGNLVDMVAYRASVIASLKVTVDQLSFLSVQTINECDPDPEEKPEKCVDNLVKRVNKLTQDLAKCFDRCENDYKDKWGNGGDTDLGRCELALALEDQAPVFFQCTNRAFAKAEKKEPWPPTMFQSFILPGIINDFNAGNNLTYNLPSTCSSSQEIKPTPTPDTEHPGNGYGRTHRPTRSAP